MQDGWHLPGSLIVALYMLIIYGKVNKVFNSTQLLQVWTSFISDCEPSKGLEGNPANLGVNQQQNNATLSEMVIANKKRESKYYLEFWVF